MALNQNLNKAKRAKNDEFYTQLADIEKELKHYKKHFKDKTVYCNCDDPSISNFFRYFQLNFNELGLKRLITTCYKNRNHELFSKHDQEVSVGIELARERERERERESTSARLPEINVFYLEGDGDFRSEECIELLKQADIVVTNPPFSLFREYISQLVEYEKKFLIIGRQNAVTYKEIFPLIKNDQVWLGITPKGQDVLFDVPEYYAKKLVANAREGSAYRVVDGMVKGRLGNAAWFTNLDHKKRHEKLILYKRYTPEEYLVYDNYEVINVNKVAEIPMDYKGMMGVPITFLDKYNPDQFEIIGSDYEVKEGLMPEIVKSTWSGKIDRGYLKGERKFARLFIRSKTL